MHFAGSATGRSGRRICRSLTSSFTAAIACLAWSATMPAAKSRRFVRCRPIWSCNRRRLSSRPRIEPLRKSAWLCRACGGLSGSAGEGSRINPVRQSSRRAVAPLSSRPLPSGPCATSCCQKGLTSEFRGATWPSCTCRRCDAWDAWYDELVQLCPNVETRLYQVETTSGLVATTSLARWVPRFEGNSGDPDRWVHGIQPAWSLDILWVPCREIVVRRSWLPREVPLSRLEAIATAKSRSAKVAINANSLGGPLRSQSLDFGWGLGVQGASELAFALPPAVRSFAAHVCLDRAAGKGGCIRGPRLRQ